MREMTSLRQEAVSRMRLVYTVVTSLKLRAVWLRQILLNRIYWFSATDVIDINPAKGELP